MSQGIYMIDSRTYIFKSVNGKLLVRVGGGYVAADKFFGQQGEVAKYNSRKSYNQNVLEYQ